MLLTTALRKLPPQLRHAVVLHYLFDLSVADIAAEIGSPVGTVTSWLSRARVELAAMLSAPPRRAPKVLTEANDVDDLDRAFSALTHDADQARPATARDVRKRGDRRTVVQAVAGVAAIAVIVAGVTVGTKVLLAAPDPDRPAPIPAGSNTPKPTPSAPPESATSPTPPPATGTTIPQAIPASAFLAADDMPGPATDGPNRVDNALPQFCGKG